MPWWAWMVVGVVLLAAEIAIQTEFWLAVLGAAALVVGLVAAGGLEGPIWVQWILFALLSVFFAVFVRRRLHEKIGVRAPGLRPELVGETARVQEEIAPAAMGSVELRGSVWRARNIGSEVLAAGSSARVESVEGLVLEIRA